jgi:hypothetical protein
VLDLDGRMDGVQYTGKFRQYTIAGGPRNPAAVARDRLIHDASVTGQRRERLFLVCFHQSAIAGHVRSEYRSELAFERRRFHRRDSFPREPVSDPAHYEKRAIAGQRSSDEEHRSVVPAAGSARAIAARSLDASSTMERG